MTNLSTIRWELIGVLYRNYGVCVSEEDRRDWCEGYQSLTDDEREVLHWKIEECDLAVPLLLEAMRTTGVQSVAELGRAKPTE